VADGSATAGRVMTPGLSRRALLTASAAALPLFVTGCKGIQALGTPPPPPADVRTLQAAISAEETMVARYASALRLLTPPRSVQYGASASVFAAYASARAVHAEHVAHLAQLRSRLIEPPGTRPSAHPPPLSPSSGPSPVAGASGRDAVLGELAMAEQAASDRLIGDLDGLPPSLAQLFASIAASEATHVEYLQAARLGR
jgi:hypothetical protein